MTSMHAVACGLMLLGIPAVQAAAQAEATVPVAPFRSVELRNGGKVILRYGPIQRVTFLKGRPGSTQVTVSSEDGLVIDCTSKHARGYELEVEIVTPELAGLSVAHGGTIESRGGFLRQAEIGVSIDNGGTIDIRSMSVGSVNASVLSGGRILARPLTMIAATVVDGGTITYWGDARVTQSIEHGGSVTKGAP